ncbi:hypothetical protein IW262DRAFT_1298291 [Armillaria fumosa]|nr:hypothetical protein IW262DRAFT_1298291 [Armillaria fumosa]
MTSRVSPELGQELDYQFSSRRSGMDGVVFEIEILKGYIFQPSYTVIDAYDQRKYNGSARDLAGWRLQQKRPRRNVPNFRISKFSYSCAFRMTLLRDQGRGLTGLPPCACHHANLKARTLPIWFWVERRAGTDSDIFMHVDIWIYHGECFKYEGTCQMDTGLASQRFTRRRTRSIDARSVGLNESHKSPATIALFPAIEEGTLTVDCYAFLFDNGRIRIWHAHPQCQPTKCKTLKCTHWDGAGVRDVGNLYSLTEWTSPLLVDIYSGSKQVVMDFDDRRLQINGLHPDARRKWVIEERTQVYRNHRLPNQGRGTDVHTTKGVENPPRFLFDPEGLRGILMLQRLQGHRVIVAMSLVLNTGKRRAAMGRDVEGNIDVGLKPVQTCLPVLDQEVNAVVPPLTDSNSGRRRRESEPLSFVDGEAVIVLIDSLRSSTNTSEHTEPLRKRSRDDGTGNDVRQYGKDSMHAQDGEEHGQTRLGEWSARKDGSIESGVFGGRTARGRDSVRRDVGGWMHWTGGRGVDGVAVREVEGEGGGRRSGGSL